MTAISTQAHICPEKKKKLGVGQIILIIVMMLFVLICTLPFINVIAMSMSSKSAILRGAVSFWPVEFNVDAYKLIVSDNSMWHSLLYTIELTVIYTVLAMVMTILVAFPLSMRRLKGQRVIMFFIVFTMYFSGGTIPIYLNVKEFGMLDSMWSLIIPGLISTFNVIILKNFFSSLPYELVEAASIDGATDFQVLTRIFLPLSFSSLATLSLFYAVGKWNSFNDALYYITSRDLQPLQLKLYNLIKGSQSVEVAVAEGSSNDLSTSVDQPLSTGEIVTAEEDIPIADREPDAIIDDPVNEPVTDEPETPAEENPDGAGNTETYTSVTRLYRVDLATGNAEQMPGYTTPEIPEGFSGYTSVNRITAGTNGSVWIYDTMNSYMVVSDPNGTDYDGIHYDSGDYVEGPSAYRLRQFSVSGEELASVDITGEDGYVRKNLIAVDENDHLYFNNWEENTATIEDASGKVLKTLDLNQNNGYMMTFCDQAAIQIYDGEKNQVTIQLIDPETLELGEPIEPPANAWSYMRSYDEAYDYYYIYNNDLYGYKQKERSQLTRPSVWSALRVSSGRGISMQPSPSMSWG